jgi:hypothetical protein
MIVKIAVLSAILPAFLVLSATGAAQAQAKGSDFAVAGRPGEAHLLQLNGKSYVEVEALARLTGGALSFKDNRTTLTLPPYEPLAVATRQAQAPPAQAPQPQAPQTQAKTGLSRTFVQASIEEMSVIREWRIGIVGAVQSNIPVSEDWAAAQHRQAEKNQALASAAVSTEDDRKALTMLSAELDSMQKLSDLYLALRTRSTAMSPDRFDNTPLEEQILNCARGFVSMTESREFQDQPACH